MQLRLHPIVLRVALLTAAALLWHANGSAQDLLARQAPIDLKMRAIDSLSLQRLIRSEEEEMPAYGLYNEWSHDHVAQYRNAVLPGEFKIDLRHFCMPTTSRVVTSSYGYRRSFRRQHKGIDVKVYIGDTIRSAFAGKVRVVKYERRGYGNYVVIRHPNGLETVYGHLSKHLVAEDQIVQAGEPIGLGGNTGRSTGSHLHFETRLLGDDINPDFMFDFENQDVKGDYYIYRSHGSGYCINAEEGETRGDIAMRGENEVWQQSAEQAEASARAAAKANESRNFQQQRAAQRSASRIHKVRQGDTLGKIAKRYHTTVQRLCNLNNIKATTTLKLGRILKVS